MAKRSKTDKADIKIRLTEALRSKIEKAAREDGVSMNSEMIKRLERSFEWDEARTTVKGWLDESHQIIRGEFEVALNRKGYVPIAATGGRLWAEPGFDLSEINLVIDAKQVANDMLPDLVEALSRALGKFAKKVGDQS